MRYRFLFPKTWCLVLLLAGMGAAADAKPWRPPDSVGSPKDLGSGGTRATPAAPSPMVAPAQDFSPILTLPQQWEPPGTVGTPGSRQTSGTRGSCLETQKWREEQRPGEWLQPSLLLPPSGKVQTASPYPDFFWYFPPNSGQGMEFSLQDDQGNTILAIQSEREKNRPLALQGELLHLVWPRDLATQPLEPEKIYTWEVTLVCDGLDRAADVISRGKIERLKGASPQTLQEAIDQRLWSETLTMLYTQTQGDPGDPITQRAWRDLLAALGKPRLGDLAPFQMGQIPPEPRPMNP